VAGWSAGFWPGRIWLALLLLGVVVLEYRTAPSDALDLGERGMAGNLVLTGGLFLFLPATIAFSLWECLRRLVRRQPAKGEMWLRLLSVAIVVAGIAVGRRSYVPENPILPEEEPIYLKIAEIARQGLAKPKGGGYLALDPRRVATDSGQEERELCQRLNALVPGYWPRALLHLSVEAECVVLERGSGMLGSVGVRIYDKGPVTFHPEAESRRNPYLPRQGRIADRLWFFTSE
jgi:hypothetical protein